MSRMIQLGKARGRSLVRAWGTRITLLITTLVAAFGASLTVSDEYEVKAAFLYNFAKFVEWPPEKFGDANSPIVIGVVGRDSFNGMLQRMVEAKTAAGRPISVRRLTRPEEMTKCHLLFVPRAETAAIAQSLPRLLDQHVLIVTEAEISPRGAIINFRIVNDSVRFAIDAEAAHAAGLKMSSKLFAVAIKS